MRLLLQNFIHILSHNSRLQPVEMLQRHAGEGLRFPAGDPLQAFQAKPDVVDDAGANVALIVKLAAHKVGQVDDDLLQHGEAGDHRIQGGIGHNCASRLEAAYRRIVVGGGLEPPVMCCGPP